MRYSFVQVKRILFDYHSLSRGMFVNQIHYENVGIKVPHIGRAGFEAACLLAAEIGVRVKRCGMDGLLVEAVFMRSENPIPESVIAREYGILDVHRRINRVVAYCTGENIGRPDDTDKTLWPMSYKVFCAKYRNRKPLYKSGTNLDKMPQVS